MYPWHLYPGDYTMSDQENTEQTPPAPAPKPQAPAPKNDELPAWAREQISSANHEAAGYRVQLREEQTARKALEEQLATLKTEHAGSAGKQAETQLHLDRLVAAVNADVPREQVYAFAKTLQGSTPEELAQHADELKGMFGFNRAAVDFSQGRGGNTGGSDPMAELANTLRNQLQF